MIKQKRYQWQRQIRRQQIQIIKKVCRQRKIMMEQIDEDIQRLKQCSLYSEGVDILPHKCFLDCEEFAVNMHERLFMGIVRVGGTEWCKKLLIEKELLLILYKVAITIQNKLIDPEQDVQNKHFYSRERVLNSIARILCLFTEDQQLIGSYSQFISNMLISSIKYENFLHPNETHKDHLIALINLFNYYQHQQSAYNQLRNINFQLIFQRYLLAIVDNRINPGDIDIDHFRLFRNYVKYQREMTDDEIGRRMVMNMSDFLVHFFDIERRDCLEMFRKEVVEEILNVSMLMNFKGEICLVVLKNPAIYQYLAYSELLSIWSYNNSFISVDDFTCPQLVEVLQALSRAKAATHAENLATALTNLLFNGHLDVQSINKVKRCLRESQTYETLCDQQRKQQCFRSLCQIMRSISQDDI